MERELLGAVCSTQNEKQPGGVFIVEYVCYRSLRSGMAALDGAKVGMGGSVRNRYTIELERTIIPLEASFEPQGNRRR
jgi:hypothetical protein